MTRRGRLGALTILLALMALAACGGGASVSTDSGPASATSTPAATDSSTATTTAAATTATTTTPSPSVLDPLVFPEADTPLANASSQLKAVWTRYKATTLPSRHTLESMPAIIKARNLTQGKLSDNDAQQLVTAEFRDNTFVAWAELNIQIGLLDFLQLPAFGQSKEIQAMQKGQAVIDPPCDLYPLASSVVVLDQASRDFFKNNPVKVTATYALVQTYEGPCEITAMTSSGKQVIDSLPSGGATAVFPGHLQHDAVLGDLWFTEGGYQCGATGAPTGLCAAAGL